MIIIEIKKDYYKWIDGYRINNNCPEKLKHWLIAIYQILENKDEKFRSQIF